MSKGLIVVIVIVVAIALMFGSTYNGLVKLDETKR